MTIRQNLRSAGFIVRNCIDFAGTLAVRVSFFGGTGIDADNQFARMYAIIGPHVGSGENARGVEFSADSIYSALFPRARLADIE